jgi:hypothetical protein
LLFFKVKNSDIATIEPCNQMPAVFMQLKSIKLTLISLLLSEKVSVDEDLMVKVFGVIDTELMSISGKNANLFCSHGAK